MGSIQNSVLVLLLLSKVSCELQHVLKYLFMGTNENVHGNTKELYVHYSMYDAYSTHSRSCEVAVVGSRHQIVVMAFLGARGDCCMIIAVAAKGAVTSSSLNGRNS